MNRLAYLFGHIGKLGGLCRGYPGKMESPGFNPNVFKQVLQECKLSSGIVITFQVMAFTRVSPGHPHTVRAVTEGSQDKLGAHPARAGHTDNPEIGRVLKTANPGQIRCTVTAPVA